MMLQISNEIAYFEQVSGLYAKMFTNRSFFFVSAYIQGLYFDKTI